MSRRAHQLIPALWLAHWPATTAWPTGVAELGQHGPWLATCLRQMSFGLAPRPPGLAARLDQGELLIGADAYRFALEVAAGLRSEIPGETNVFGQLRQAISQFQHQGMEHDVRRLQPVLDLLLKDTREIRRRCLQGIGGLSYGSLVRRLLGAGDDERLLFVGSGELARSMLPLFSQQQTGLWNHRPLSAPLDTSVQRLFAPAEADAAAHWADHVIMTTPADPAHDAAWCARLAGSRVRTLVHLGHRGTGQLARLHEAAKTIRLLSLDEIFALASEQASRRETRLAEARALCAQKAQAVAVAGQAATGTLLATA